MNRTHTQKLALFSAIVLSLSLLSACGDTVNGLPVSSLGKENTAQTTPRTDVIIAIGSEPENGLDPTLGWGHGATPLIQSTLVEYTQDMQIVNDLATAHSISEDGLVWSFTLREDAFFTDGTPVLASDVAYTFTTAKNSSTSLDLNMMQTCIPSGDYSLTFTLTAPCSTFINTIATIGIVPQHAHNSSYANAPIGSGPWKFVQWNKGEQMILEANENYYGTPPAIQRATLVFMAEDVAFAAAQGGQVDVALTSATHATQEVSGMRLHRVTTMDNRGITLPVQPAAGQTTESGHPIGNDVTSHLSIRKALAYGIDRQQIAQDAVNGFAQPAYSENDGMPWNNPDVKIDTDIEKAKLLLAQDGWTDTDNDGVVEKDTLKAEFTCLYPSGDSVRQAIVMAAAEQALTLGIRIVPLGVGWDEISKKMFSNATLMGWGDTNPYTSYLLFHSKNRLRDDYYNPEGFEDPAVDATLESALRAVNPEQAHALWQKAQWDGTTGTSMKGNCPFVWLVNIQHLYYVRDTLDIGLQQLHAHGASWTLLQNLKDWQWNA